MCGIFWGAVSIKEEKTRMTELLEPRYSHLVNRKALAWLRLLLSVFFIVTNAIVVAVNFEQFWQFLTNITHFMCMFTYTALSIAHFQNGDFACSKKVIGLENDDDF